MTPLLHAGAGRAEVELPESVFPVDGFTGVHDPLHVRVLLLRCGDDAVAVVAADQTSIFDDTLALLRTAVAAEASISPAQVVVAASHTFSAPHVLPADRVAAAEQEKNEALRTALVDAARCAARAAADTLRPALIDSGLGRSRVNVNRDVPTADGWWLGADPHGVTDDAVSVLRVDDDAGAPIAVLAVYAVQSSVMNEATLADGDRLVGADLAGAVCAHVEAEFGGDVVALFLCGAAGDQAPLLTAAHWDVDREGRRSWTDVHEAGFALIELLGRRLAAEVVRVADSIRAAETSPVLAVIEEAVLLDGQEEPRSYRDLEPTTRYVYRAAEPRYAPVVIVRLGGAVIVGVQVELNVATGQRIRELSPWPTTMVATIVNGAAKYLPDTGSYDRMTYEAMNSRYARGGAERLAERILELLQALAQGRAFI